MARADNQGDDKLAMAGLLALLTTTSSAFAECEFLSFSKTENVRSAIRAAASRKPIARAGPGPSPVYPDPSSRSARPRKSLRSTGNGKTMVEPLALAASVRVWR